MKPFLIFLKHLIVFYVVIVIGILIFGWSSEKPGQNIEAVILFTFYGGPILCAVILVLWYIFYTFIYHIYSKYKKL